MKPVMTALDSRVPSSIQINSRNPRVSVNVNVATTRQHRLIRRQQSKKRKLSKFCLHLRIGAGFNPRAVTSWKTHYQRSEIARPRCRLLAQTSLCEDSFIAVLESKGSKGYVSIAVLESKGSKGYVYVNGRVIKKATSCVLRS
ncbi:hypothetical protein HanLR1_Chr07g0256981 [Helianthus annuus]|nr:hypothetical protein HanHA89_Chr07g0274721 [Helianthus annuus]KAJ0729800.1 hypothetical protein HanLR1_Chr07g0256981 [Helianthus annuus]